MNELDFRRGYYLAVAEIVRQHGMPTIAASVLRTYGKVDLRGIDEFDQPVLRELCESEHIPVEHSNSTH